MKRLATYLLAGALLLMAPWQGSGAYASQNNPNTDWFSQAKYGGFFHYLPGLNGITANSPTDWNNAVNSFNVSTFASQAAATGAKYVYITLGQNSGYYLSPNSKYNQYAGSGKTSTRDLPNELYDALNPLGIKLMLYLPSDAPVNDSSAANGLGVTTRAGDGNWNLTTTFRSRWSEVIQEWSDRYGSKVAGWWFDGAYDWVGFNGTYASAYTTAAKHGNANGIVTFNGGADSIMTRFSEEDYTSGELTGFAESQYPASRWTAQQTQWHALSHVSSTWGGAGVNYTETFLANYISNVSSHGGVVSLDMAVNRDGSLSTTQRTFMNGVKQRLADTATAIIDDHDPRVVYTGSWLDLDPGGCYANTCHNAQATGRAADLTFTGTALTWYSVTGPDQGTANVYIDGVLDRNVNLYASTRTTATPVYARTGLAAGNHTFRIVTTSAGWVTLDYLAITNATTPPPTGTVDDGDPRVVYTGSWLDLDPGGCYANTCHNAQATGRAADLTFTGTALTWYSVTGPDQGTANVYIDGVLDRAVNLYAPTRTTSTPAYTKTGLAAGSHTFRIVTTSAGWVTLDYLTIT